MQMIPDQFLDKLKGDNTHHSILEIEKKIQKIIGSQPPIFFPQYTDHGINHFHDTLKMALHLMSLDESERKQGEKAVLEYLTPLNVFILSAAVLFHDLGMHIHFNGFKQLINGFYDDVRVEYFNDLTWKEEWDNFMIEAKRFSGRERVNLFGDEQVIIKDIDFTKQTVDSDIQKHLIGEFIRRHHGRLAHEIALKGFPVKDKDVISFANDIQSEYKDIFGLIARSHSMNVRNAMEYVEEMFPGDPHFPYSIEVPFLMCVLRIADYFQIDNTRTNAFLIKLKSFTSPFSLNEHKAHLATEYFKTDEKDPETLYVDAKPSDGLMYTKLLRLFEDIQKELDTSFAIIGEMYGRHKTHFKLRYRRIKSNLKNRKVIAKYPYVPDIYKFEADTDLFKLLVGPLYGYDPGYGIREMIQNAVDACIELQYKLGNAYEPVINVSIENKGPLEYEFTISDNGKGMSLGEIKNYYLKAGASFRNSTEWKMDYQQDDHTSCIRRNGKFGIGVLASFLVGDFIEVTTKRFNEPFGYTFNTNLNQDFIEIRKNNNCNVGTTIKIRMKREAFGLFWNNTERLTRWYIFSNPKINYYLDNNPVKSKGIRYVKLVNGKQKLKNAFTLVHDDFDDIIWTYELESGLAINGIIIPDFFLDSQEDDFEWGDGDLDYYPFVSIIDRNNRIDLDLNRNNIRGELVFIKELIEQCQLDFLFKLLFFEAPIENNVLCFKDINLLESEKELLLNCKQFYRQKIYVTTVGYFIDNKYYDPLVNDLDQYLLFKNDFFSKTEIALLPNSVFSLYNFNSKSVRKSVFGRGSYTAALVKSNFWDGLKSEIVDAAIIDFMNKAEIELDYVYLFKGDLKNEKKEKLIEIIKLNNLVAAQITNKALSNNDNVNLILKKYLGEPSLIPHDKKKRKAYIKTLHPDLIKYIIEKRGVKLD